MKYIRFKNAGFVVFGKFLKHSDMARKFPKDIVESAGEVSIFDATDENSELSCYGESVSLNVTSHAKDSQLLTRQLFPYRD